MAAKDSIDPASRTQGGEVGLISAGNVPTALAGVVTSLDPGQISAPIHETADWYILQVRMVPTHVTPFDQVEASIIAAKVSAIQSARFAVWWRKVLAAYDKRVTYLDPSLASKSPAVRPKPKKTTSRPASNSRRG
jgi:parvulin-like peptidyl-prolyl isomerase